MLIIKKGKISDILCEIATEAQCFQPQMGDFCPEKVSKGIKVACSGGRRERRDKGLGSAEFTGTKQQVNQTKQKECQ